MMPVRYSSTVVFASPIPPQDREAWRPCPKENPLRCRSLLRPRSITACHATFPNSSRTMYLRPSLDAQVVRRSGWCPAEVESMSLEGEGIERLGTLSFRGVEMLMHLNLANNKLSSLQVIILAFDVWNPSLCRSWLRARSRTYAQWVLEGSNAKSDLLPPSPKASYFTTLGYTSAL